MTKGTLLVTGATGLVGSALCIAALKAGYAVRGLVRTMEDTGPLAEAGVELVTGDVTDIGSLLRALQGARDVIHTAAVLGGTWSKSKPEDFWAVNYQGVLNVLDAARDAGTRRCVLYSSMAILDWSCTASNTSPILPIGATDSNYTRAKRAAFYAGMHRASLDQDIVTVVPSGIYGPAPLVDRAIVPTSYTGTLLLALRGELTQYVQMPHSWAFVDDVVAVGLAALERGINGGRYLAVGREEDSCSLAELCNRCCEIAGVSHRVKDLDLANCGEEIGPMRVYAERKYAKPYVDPSGTAVALGVAPTPMHAALRRTVGWFREVGLDTKAGQRWK